MPDVFISYSRRDKEFVERLSKALEAHGKQAWVDWEDIPASAEWLREIQDGIDASDAFLFVLTPDSASSDVCARELEHALERRKRIVPIVHRDVDPTAVPEEAAALNWVYLRDQDSFEKGLEELVKALDTDLEYVRAHTRLASQAIHWNRAGKERASLLRGSELRDAERWLTAAAAKQPAATELQARFVQASRDAARRRGRTLFSGVAFALMVAVALAIVALIQRANAIHQSQIAYSRLVDAYARNEYSSDPELSVLLAVQAVRIAPGLPTREALRLALFVSDIRERYTNPKGPIGDALWSPDGTRLLIADEGADQAEIVRPGTRAKPIILSAPGISDQIAWASRGDLAATGGSRPAVWNGRTGALVRALPARVVAFDVAMSPSGDRLATVDLPPSERLHVWDVRTGKELGSGPTPPGVPNCMSFSPDGSVIAECVPTGSGQHTTGELILSSGQTGRPFRIVNLPGPFDGAGVAFSPDSRLVAVASNPGGTRVLNIRTGAVVFHRPGPATAVDFSFFASQLHLAYSPTLGNIAFVHTFGGGPDQPLVGSSGAINSIRFSPAGSYVITASTDGTARVFDSVVGTEAEVLSAGDGAAVTDARMNAGETALATASMDGSARVWARPVPQPQMVYPLAAGSPVALAYSPVGQRVAMLGPHGSGALLDVPTLRRLASLTAPTGSTFDSAMWSTDGRTLVALLAPVGSASAVPSDLLPNQAEVYSAARGWAGRPISLGRPVVDAAVNGRDQLASITATGQGSVWSLDSARRLGVFDSPGAPAQWIAYSQDSSRLLVTHADGTIDVLDSTTGRRLVRLRGPRHPPNPVINPSIPIRAAFSPDGRWIASAGANLNVQLWNAATGRLVADLGPAGTTQFVSLAFSPDSGTLAAGDAASARLWRVPSGDYIGELQHASSSQFNSLGEPYAGVHVTFSADGQTLLTTGDLSVRAWHWQTLELVFDTFGTFGVISPDANWLLAGPPPAPQVREYRCDLCGGLQDLLATAKRNTTRALTAGERALYLRSS